MAHRIHIPQSLVALISLSRLQLPSLVPSASTPIRSRLFTCGVMMNPHLAAQTRNIDHTAKLNGKHVKPTLKLISSLPCPTTQYYTSSSLPQTCFPHQ
ncbi:hypothetical protein B0H16DRAFT_1535559 [Mycena metata]|uniref:Secreted protein n=1 Tax=Mycena metata TaxID=1033252 RepID=A0AAD7J7F7_9AGAR|nr:hypothetical protein B0H16DRAFT_1535559 [Mycena metata]